MKAKILLPILAATISLSACIGKNGNQGAQSEPTIIDHTKNEEVATEMPDNEYDNEDTYCEANDLALFIAGKDNDKYAELQKSDYYKEYSKQAKQNWDELNKRTLSPIKEWCKTNIPEFYNDTTCLFYPFGGPDLIFAMTFFPHEKDYVLFGLENPGHLCEPDQITDNQLTQYLDSLQYSFRYLNKYGFFVASHMLQDFNNKDLNGTLHLALYTLAQENCKITKYRDIYLDDHGDIQEGDGKMLSHPYGWELTFKREGSNTIYSAKYFKFNAEDEAIAGRMEFPFYLNNIKNKACYFKSASYLMQSTEFGIMQKLILNQCDRILQDESGFSFARLKKGYDIKLFGTYTRPLKVFKIFPQNDLKEALANSKSLPFKIGYASQLNESVLMACTKNENIDKQGTVTTINKTGNESATVAEQPVPTVATTQELIYKVQFLVSWHRLQNDSPEFNGLKNVECYKDDKCYKYTVGSFKSDTDCQQLLADTRAKGFKDAFIVKFRNGKRIK